MDKIKTKDTDNLEKDEKNNKEHKKEEEDNVEPKMNVIESNTNIAKTGNDKNVGEGKDTLEIDENNIERTEDKEDKNDKMVEEKTDREEHEPIDETQDNECSNPIIDVDTDDHVGSASLPCNLDEVFATTESKEKVRLC